MPIFKRRTSFSKIEAAKQDDWEIVLGVDANSVQPPGYWEGWSHEYDEIPLDKENSIKLTKPEDPDPDIVGFAYPLAPVEFALRNTRRFPPPTAEEMEREMFKLFHHTMRQECFKRSYVLSIVYNHINRNRRDGPGWQRALIEAGGVEKLKDFWELPAAPESSSPAPGNTPPLTDRYWVMAIIGRMLGTSAESRTYLLQHGGATIVIEGTTDTDQQVRDCALYALKGLVQFPDGKAVVTYDKLIQCFSGAVS